jgi:ribosomal protein L11 methyltransferase
MFITNPCSLKYKMPWLQIILDTDAATVEQISDGLFAVGAVSVTMQDAQEQPLYEPPLNSTPRWKRTRVVGLFEGDTDSTELQSQLQAVLAPLPPYQIQTLEDQEWSRVWMDEFHPMRFGERVWICPSWQTPPEPQAVNILLDPGLAFGTGTHTTTALCLEWLDQQSDLSGKTRIDYGCGSGILAITAVKLGAARVWAVDNDPQALLATEENAKKNKVETDVNPVLPEQLPDFQADGVLANILAMPLIKLATTLAAHLNAGAPLVLSGILKEQCDNVITAYTPYFTITEIVERENWMRIVAYKNHSR